MSFLAKGVFIYITFNFCSDDPVTVRCKYLLPLLSLLLLLLMTGVWWCSTLAPPSLLSRPDHQTSSPLTAPLQHLNEILFITEYTTDWIILISTLMRGQWKSWFYDENWNWVVGKNTQNMWSRKIIKLKESSEPTQNYSTQFRFSSSPDCLRYW